MLATPGSDRVFPDFMGFIVSGRNDSDRVSVHIALCVCVSVYVYTDVCVYIYIYIEKLIFILKHTHSKRKLSELFQTSKKGQYLISKRLGL